MEDMNIKFKQEFKDNSIEVKFPPTKGFDRTLEKQYDYQNETKMSQPSFKLKDVTRLSNIFKNFKDMLEFYNFALKN